MALARTATGYRLYWGVYVRPVSWITRPYLMAIEPFRRFIVYPAMLRRIRRAWLAAYGHSPTEEARGLVAIQDPSIEALRPAIPADPDRVRPPSFAAVGGVMLSAA
jgi:hypothetical protein